MWGVVGEGEHRVLARDVRVGPVGRREREGEHRVLARDVRA